MNFRFHKGMQFFVISVKNAYQEVLPMHLISKFGTEDDNLITNTSQTGSKRDFLKVRSISETTL
jgi:hypothetical protein